MAAPETITEALEFLAAAGYTDELRLERNGLVRHGSDGPHPFATAVVEHTFRFEGDSDPADESIVLGVRCPGWDAKGVVVSAYGPGADPEEADLLVALTG